MNSFFRARCLELPATGQAPESVTLIPAPDSGGRVHGRDGRQWTFNAAAVAAAFDRPLPIDINHAQEIKAPKGEESPAAGWIEALSAEADGSLKGRVRWTERGAELLRGLAYRFLSPAFDYDAKGQIARLVSAGLVNNPNFDLALNSAQKTESTMLDKLLVILGLAATTDETTALNAVTALKTDHTRALNAAQSPPLDRFVPRADHDLVLTRATNAEKKLADLQKAQADAAINTEIEAALAAGKITPATADYHRAMCAVEGGLERFKAFVNAAPVIGGGKGADRVANDTDGKTLNDNERALCVQMGVSEQSYIESRALNAKTYR